MAATATPQVPPSSIEATGVSVATTTKDPTSPRQGSAYTGDLTAAVPVWFHPLNTGRHVMVMARHQSAGVTGTQPAWAVVDPATGDLTGLETIPSNLATGDRTLVSAASRGDYLFLLSNTAYGSLIQHFRVTGTGGMSLLGEKRDLPGLDGTGLFLDGNHLWVFGRHESGTLAVARRNWGRIGAATNTDPQMNWLYRTARGWSSDPAELVPLNGDLPADGPCSVAALGDRFYLITTVHTDGSWTAQGYTSRLLDSGWTKHPFTVDLGGDGYLGGTVQLQPQLPLTPGYTVTATTGGATVLTGDATRVQVLTGHSGHVLTLPSALTSLEPFTVYNQSTADVTVTSSGGATVAVVERGTGATLTPASLAPDITASWTRDPVTARTPTARTGFPYVVTTAPDTVTWHTAWDVFAV